ncbi:MAG: thrombospondin type 3 repeat-containing protein [Phycisphaerales bacterium]|nr:thrombospondin type 3 repeat-containing protein [Phycisphaerales bacterium]
MDLGNWIRTAILTATLCASPGLAGVTAHYPLDEGTGTTAFDNAGGLDGTIQGASWGASGEAKNGNSCLVFGASGDAVSLPGNAINALSDGTFMCWIYPTGNFNSGPSTGNSQYYIVSKQNAGVSALFDVWLDLDGRVRTNIGGADSYPGSVCRVQLNTWNHVAITWDGTEKRVFVNGVFDSAGGTATVSDSPQTTYIGRNVTHVDDRFIGRIDDVRLFDQALTDEEISQFADMVAYYALDEGTGSTAIDSANGLDGTVQGASWGASGEAKEGNSCLVFGASGDAVSLPGNTINALPEGTFMCWIYPTGDFNSGPSTGNSQYYIVSKQVAGVIAVFDVWLDLDGRVRTNIGGADSYPGSICRVQLNTWNHVAITWDGTEKRVFVNGVFDSAGGTATVSNNPQATYVGRSVTHADDRFIGRIDDIRVYGYPISGEAIAECTGLPPIDTDCDGVPDELDNCPTTPNPDQADCDNDGIGDACDTDCNPNTVAHWRFNGDYSDSCGPFDGTPVGSASISPTDPAPLLNNSGCLLLDGDPSRVDLAAPFSNSVETLASGTIEAWVKLEEATPGESYVIFNHGVAALTTDLLVGITVSSQGAFDSTICQTNIACPTVPMPSFSLHNWHHMAWTWSPSLINFYLDGALIGSSNVNLSVSFAGNEAEIGSDDQEFGYWIGKLDEIRISRVALSPSDLLFNNDCNANGIPDRCEPDTDEDGVIDDCDVCPDVSDPDQLDQDGDGTGDACDLCPLDPNKIEPGICGCGFADAPDTDGDGLPNDCDLDDDNDGVPDVDDVCPANAVGLPVDCNGRALRDCNGDCEVNGLDLQCIVNELLGN